MEVTLQSREALVRRGIRLSYATIGYNFFEAIGSLIAGFLAGSVALVGFGIDSVIEVTASIGSVATEERLGSRAPRSRGAYNHAHRWVVLPCSGAVRSVRRSDYSGET